MRDGTVDTSFACAHPSGAQIVLAQYLSGLRVGDDRRCGQRTNRGNSAICGAFRCQAGTYVGFVLGWMVRYVRFRSVSTRSIFVFEQQSPDLKAH